MCLSVSLGQVSQGIFAPGSGDLRQVGPLVAGCGIALSLRCIAH